MTSSAARKIHNYVKEEEEISHNLSQDSLVKKRRRKQPIIKNNKTANGQ